MITPGERYKLAVHVTTMAGVRFCRDDVLEVAQSWPIDYDPSIRAPRHPVPSMAARLRTDDGRQMLVSGESFLRRVASLVIWPEPSITISK